jgi:hypothetical protein
MIKECILNRPIEAGDKAIICLGDSFVHGQGAWTKKTFKKHNYSIHHTLIKGDIEKEMYENSWPHQLTRNHLPDYISINLGNQGTGNRAAVKELYLNPYLNLDRLSGGILIYMLSGIERLDVTRRYWSESKHYDTVWPDPTGGNPLSKPYATYMWSDHFSIMETITNIKEAELYAKANNLHFILVSAFEQRYNQSYFNKHTTNQVTDIVASVPWGKFFRPQNYQSFIELLLNYENKPELASGDWYNYYTNLKSPSTYVTNCCHPTIQGYEVISNELFKYIDSKGYV